MADPKIVVKGKDEASGAFASIRKELAALRGEMDLLPKSVQALGASFVAAFSARALASQFAEVADGLASLNDAAVATGSTVEKLSALEDVAMRSGNSMDTATDAVVKLNKVLNEAQPDSAAEQALTAIGLSVEELRRLDPVDALQRVAEALDKYADDGNKARLMLVLLGKGMRDLAPLLHDLAGAGQLVATVTKEQADEAKKYTDNWDSLKKTALDAARTLSGPVIEELNKVTEWYRRGTAEGKNFARMLWEGRSNMQHGATGSWGEPDKPKLPDSAVPADKKKPKISDLQKYTDMLLAAQIATLNLSAEEQARYDIATGKLGKLTAAQQQQITDLARGVDIMKGKYGELADAQETFRKAELAATEATNAAMRQAVSDLDAQIDAFSGRTADRLKRSQTERLTERLNAGEVFTPEELERIVSGIAGITPVIKEHTDEWVALSERAGEQISLALTSAAGDAITHWEGVSHLLKGVLQDLAQIAMRETVLKPMSSGISGALKGFDFGSLLGGGSSGGTNWGSLIDLFGSSFGGGYFAAGGDPPLNKISVVGERGPEFFVPRQAGTIVPMGRGGAGAGHTFNVSINLAPGARPDDWNRSKRQITSDLQRSLRRAGAIA